MHYFTHYFTKTEQRLWTASVLFIALAFFLFDGRDYFTLAASLIGATSLIFCARGNPIGQVLMILFSLLYGYISYSFAYYGEMITYLGMTMPLAVIALVTWLRHPFEGNRAEVAVNRLAPRELLFAFSLSLAVTFVFYFILCHFNTANLLPSTLSVTTSFFAVYLTLRRSPFYALAYAANDVVLIVLWILATMENISYLSVVVCFAVFLVNDLYGFHSWKIMQRRQLASAERN